jgi:hypothetical protein
VLLGNFSLVDFGVFKSSHVSRLIHVLRVNKYAVFFPSSNHRSIWLLEFEIYFENVTNIQHKVPIDPTNIFQFVDNSVLCDSPHRTIVLEKYSLTPQEKKISHPA